jgi:hypothetical protein
MSLENTYNAKDLEEWDTRIQKILEKNNKIKDPVEDDAVFGTGIILETQEGKYIFQKRDHNTKLSP